MRTTDEEIEAIESGSLLTSRLIGRCSRTFFVESDEVRAASRADVRSVDDANISIRRFFQKIE